MQLRSLVFASVLILAGCSSPLTPPVVSAQPDFNPLTQDVKWADCEVGFECATVLAPLNWLSENKEFVNLEMIRKSGTQDLPPLLVNPGGPGSSGYDWLRDGYDTLGSKDLRSKFQLIAFDPRGVQHSTAVTCTDTQAKDELYYGQSGSEYGSEADLAWTQETMNRFVESCLGNSPDTGYFNTQQAARDLEMFRVILGMPELDYLGYSYGTLLGATYAALFPDKVGKMVLDGAIDPTISSGENLVNQVAGFDGALRNYLEECLGQSLCPFSGTVDEGIARIAGFLAARELKTLPTDFDRELGVSAALSGIIAALYSQDSWVYLSQAFAEAFNGDGSTMLLLADFYNDRDTNNDSYLSNINEANAAINCADEPRVLVDHGAINQQIRQASEVFGKYFESTDLGCAPWPEGKGLVSLDFGVRLANGPLVVGTTNDPATPYSQAVSLSKILDGAKLLTFNGEGHTAYGSNFCVDALVESYLAGEDLGQGDLTCS